jgi:protein gp37
MYEAKSHGLDVEPDDDPPWPLKNVWLGVSVEDQRTADERIPVLLSLPAAVRWVSYEPALGPVRFERIESEDGEAWVNALTGWWSGNDTPWPSLDWIVVGGESGPGARPFDLAWARSTISACREAGVPVFVKQLGAHPVVSVEGALVARGLYPTDMGPAGRRPEPWHLDDHKGGDPSEWPEDLRVREWP